MRPAKDPKLCPVCSKYKPRTEFYPRKHLPNAVTSACKLCTNAAHKNWYENNREHDIASTKAWREANPEWAKQQQRDWKAKNYDKKKELDHRRRTRKQANGIFVISPKDLRRLAGPCTYCGSVERITMDHVIPISRGGTHGIGNLVPCCNKCNTVKNARTIMEWRVKKASKRS